MNVFITPPIKALEKKNPFLATKLLAKELHRHEEYQNILVIPDEDAEVFFIENSFFLLENSLFFEKKLQKGGQIFLIEDDLTRLFAAIHKNVFFTFLEHPMVEILEKEQLTEPKKISWGWKVLFCKRAYPYCQFSNISLEPTFVSIELVFSEYKDFGAKVLHNVYLNSFESKKALLGDVLDLSDCCLVICGAGPSLAKNIEKIKKMQEKGIVCAAGSSAHYLVSHGVRVDVVAAIDPDLPSQRFEFFKTGSDTILFYSLRTDPKIVKLAKKRKLVFRGSGESLVENKIWEEKDLFKESFSERGWNVVNFLASIAAQGRAKEVIFVGAEGAYENGYEYPEGVTYEEKEKKPILLDGVLTRKDLWIGKKYLDELKEKFPKTIWKDSSLWNEEKSQGPCDFLNPFYLKLLKLPEFETSIFAEKLPELLTRCDTLLQGVLKKFALTDKRLWNEYFFALELTECEETPFYQLVLERVWQVWQPLLLRNLPPLNDGDWFFQKMLFLSKVCQSFNFEKR